MSTNILIRAAEPSDYLDIQKIFSDPAVIAGTLQLPYPTAELWRQKLATPPPSMHSLVACVSDEVVGQLSLIPTTRPRRNHTAGLGMAVRSDFHGRGLGSRLMAEAIHLAENWLNISRIELDVYTDNKAAIHLYKKFNFKIEGTHRNYVFRDGEYVDSYSMARIRV